MPSGDKQKKTRRNQYGGNGSNYSALWHSPSPDNIQNLSTYTASRLDNTPMFNPLRFNTVVATPTSGLVPTGVHLGNRPASSNNFCQTSPLWAQNGGGTNNSWINHVKQYATSHDISYRDALRSNKCRQNYHK